ncbi:MAG: endonuclease domain-containing protein [Novosphingobium sp.]
MREGLGEGLLHNNPTDRGYSRPTLRSRELRQNATEPEKRLWSALSARKVAGVRFNRQFPVGPFICDFVSRGAKLVIEVDGETHVGREAEDAARTRFLGSQGYRVIRFTNTEVMTNLDGVVRQIEIELSHRPSPNPSRKREGSLWGPTVKWYEQP